ncbi:MAG TPA: hypothetical protein PLD10_16370, partial [Rhodopila sp.]|nr:hypothetical protein [Rhodopila sp.]
NLGVSLFRFLLFANDEYRSTGRQNGPEDQRFRFPLYSDHPPPSPFMGNGAKLKQLVLTYAFSMEWTAFNGNDIPYPHACRGRFWEGKQHGSDECKHSRQQ